VYKGDAFSNPSSVIDMLKAEYPNAEQLNESIEPPNLAELNPNKQCECLSLLKHSLLFHC